MSSRQSTEYGVFFPRLNETRIITKWHGSGRLLAYMRDIETGFTACEFTHEKCKNTLENMLLRKSDVMVAL
jgi:hypothetical protein